MGGQNQDPTAHGTLWNLTLGEPVARAQLLQQQVANAQLNQAATRAGLFQDPASRAALFADPAMLRLMHLQASQVPLGGATMQQFPQLSPGDQPLLSHITQVPTNLPAMVMTPDRAQMLQTLGQVGGSSQNELLQQLLSGQFPGWQPSSFRTGGVEFKPQQQPGYGDQPIGGAPAAGGDARTLSRIPQATRQLGSAFIQGMVKRGWTPEEAAAAAGNIQAESGFDPGIQEKQPIAGRGGYGLLQWTGPRRQALENFAQATGRTISDPEVQMDFLHAERTGASTQYGGPDESANYARAFQGGGDPTEMAARFGQHVERPANLSASVQQRMAAAQSYYGDAGAQGGGIMPANYQDPTPAELGARFGMPPQAQGGGAGGIVPATYQVPAGYEPLHDVPGGGIMMHPAQRIAYPSPAPQEDVAPGAMQLAPPTPLPGSPVAAPQQAPPPGPPPAMPGGGPAGAPMPTGPPMGGGGPSAGGGSTGGPPPQAYRDLQGAAARDPELAQVIQGMSPNQALTNPWVQKRMGDLAEQQRIQQQQQEAAAKHQQEAPWERQKTAEAHGWQLETEGRQQQVQQQAKQQEQAQKQAPLARPYVEMRQAIRGFTPQEIQQYTGPTTGITNLWSRDPGYTTFQGKIADITTSALAGARSPAERDAILRKMPTGRESPDEFVAKLRHLDTTAASQEADVWKGVSPEARAPYQTDFPSLDEVFNKGARTLARPPAEPPRQLAPAQPAPEAAPALPPGTSVTTTPTTTSGAVPAPVGAPAPPAAAPSTAAPQGGISAAQAAAGPRSYDIAMADRLGLAQPYPGETPEETQARQAENVRRLQRGEPAIPRRPAELPGAPTQMATRMLSTLSGLSQPQNVGQTAKAALGATGAPGAVVGGATEDLTGSRAAGTAAQVATDLAPAVGPAVRTIAKLAAPSLAAPELATLSREAVPDLTARLGAKAAAALQPGAGGMVLKPVVAAQVGQVQDALKAATAATDAATQAEHLARAAKLIAKVPGSSPDDVAALTTLSKQMSQQVRTVQRYQAAGKAAGRVVGAGTVYHLAKKAMGPIGDYFTGGDQGGQ